MQRALALLCLTLAGAQAAAPSKAITPWSFEKLQRPAVPKVLATEWPEQELDSFVLAKLEAAKLAPSADAPRAALLRRATLDLHGLLPTVAELDAFERDSRPDDAAFASVVDALLQSPRFGERWARHWLDVVRYADSTGRAWNAPLIYAFRYRDWVIDAFNEDLPYTSFMAQQVAGDLLPAKDTAQRASGIIATGMLTLGSLDLTEGNHEMGIMNRIDDQIDVTTRAFLGLTIACARCHDHKYDPISQRDYYALAGMFYSTRTLSGTASKTDMGRNLYVDPDRLASLTAASTTSSSLPQRSAAAAASMEMIGEEVTDNKGYRIGFAYDPSLAMAVAEDEIQDCPIRVAGDPQQLADTPHRGDWAIPLLPPMPRVPAGSSGRLQLAQWLTTTTHPLTSRVMANRLWGHLMGRGIVSTPDDFGITGERPDNAALLDHLAVRLVQGGWSMKSFLRMLMLSRTYRQSADGTRAEAMKQDPDNLLRWRQTPRRLEVEVLRDTLLQAADVLSTQRPQGIQIAGNGGKGKDARTRSLLAIDASYRTIYLPVLRDLLPEMLETWDFPNPSQIKGQREVTTVPPQALFLMNSAFAQDAAEAIASRLAEDQPHDGKRIQHTHRLLLSRTADPEEVKDAEDYLQSTGGDWPSYVQSILASAEYRYAR
jgi:hypothetical protein